MLFILECVLKQTDEQQKSTTHSNSSSLNTSKPVWPQLVLFQLWPKPPALHCTQTWCTWCQSLLHVPWPHLHVQQSCKPHWLSSVIHTHYYFTSSGTAALTALVSPALIREKGPLHTYAHGGLPFQSAIACGSRGEAHWSTRSAMITDK